MDEPTEPDRARPETTGPLEAAAALAGALDADDFDSAVALFDENVVHRIGEHEHRGPAAVTASDRKGSASARRTFERVEYSHQIVGLVGERTVRIDFADALHAGGERVDHHSIQDVEVGRDGRIVSITDRPVPGQRRRVDAFTTRHGLLRDDPPPG